MACMADEKDRRLFLGLITLSYTPVIISNSNLVREVDEHPPSRGYYM